MDPYVRRLVEADWETRLGVDRSVLYGGGVHVLAGDLGANDAMSFLVEQTCIVLVRDNEVDPARQLLANCHPQTAFSGETLRALVGQDALVDGPSIHSYVDDRGFTGTPDRAAIRVEAQDAALVRFLRSNADDELAESSFAEHPDTDDGTTSYWVLREGDQVLAAGNMTPWRGLPSDVGILTSPVERGRGLARRLVGAMVAAALPAAGVVRYRALASNVASLAVARRLGFEPYGANFRARRSTPVPSGDARH